MLIIAALVVGFLVGATAIMVFASLAISDTSHYRKEAAFYKKHAEDWEGLAMEYKQIAFELAKKESSPLDQKQLEEFYNKAVVANLAYPERSE